VALGAVSLAIVLALGLGLPESALGTVALRVGIERLTRESDAVVAGRVLEVRGEEQVRGGRRALVTAATLEVREAWKGAPGPRLRVYTHGGVVGRRAATVAGEATFAPGEEVVVFAMWGGGAWWPTGMAQGKWRVVRAPGAAPVAVQGTDAETTFVAPTADGRLAPLPGHGGAWRLPLAELRSRVARASGEAAR
jgi:hypothetical protein